MSYDAFEQSVEDGRPIILYTFQLNDKVWRYAAADTDITVAGNTYTAVPIGDDGMNQTGDSATDALTITSSANIEPAMIYMAYPPAATMGVTVHAFHEGDTDVQVIYVGVVQQVNVPVPGTCKIKCETLSATIDRAGLRLSWSRNCNYALYDQATCKVNRAAHAVAVTVASVVDNQEVHVAGPLTVNRFAGGYIEWTTPDRGTERRAIESNTATVLMMFGTADGIVAGMAATLYPGCNRTTADCSAKFANLMNYGGIPAMQGWSPFDGNPVFY